MENSKDVRKLLESFDKALDETNDVETVEEEVVEEEVVEEEVIDEAAEEVEESTFRKAVRENDQAEEAVEELSEIQRDLYDVIERLDAAIRNYLPHNHSNLEAYLLAPLKIRAGSDQYVSNDPSIDKVIQMVQDEYYSGEDEMDESKPEWPEEVKGTGQFPGDTHPDQDNWGDDEDDEMPRGPTEEGVGDDLEGMQKQSQQQGDELDDLKSKLDRLKGRVNNPEPGYDDRSRRGVKRVRR